MTDLDELEANARRGVFTYPAPDILALIRVARAAGAWRDGPSSELLKLPLLERVPAVNEETIRLAQELFDAIDALRGGR